MESSIPEKSKEILSDVKPNTFLNSLFGGNQKTSAKSPVNKNDLESGSIRSEKVPTNSNQGITDHFQGAAEDPQSATDDTSIAGQTEAEETTKEGIPEAPKDHWKHFYDAIDERDEEFCKALRDEISDLLLIAALLLGVVTAFTIEAFDWLRDDPVVTLLQKVVTLLNETATIGVEIDPQLGQLKDYELTVNQLWLLSMILSLSAVIFGTLCLQWISVFRHADDKYKAGPHTLALRQVRYEGIWAWGVPHIPALLIVTVQAALVFFIVGLLYLLWNVNKRAALPVAVVSGISTFAVGWTVLLPVLLSVICYLRPSLAKTICQCPYKNPWTWITHRGSTLIGIIFSFPLTFIPSRIRNWILTWRRSAVKLLMDFRWLEYDEMWRQRRDPDVKEGLCSYYLLTGLGAVVDTLGSHHSTGHFIEKCLQDIKFHESPVDIEAMKKSFEGLRFTPAEEAVLEHGTTAGSPPSANAESKAHDLAQLRKDFLTALILEQLVSRSRPLKRSLLRVRVKHYSRLKASVYKAGLASTVRKNSGHRGEGYIGELLECPIRHIGNAESLSSVERSFYIKCVAPLISTNQLDEKDVIGLRLILSTSESLDNHHSNGKHNSESPPTRKFTGDSSASSSPQPPAATPNSLLAVVTPTPHDPNDISQRGDHSRQDSSWHHLRQTRDKLDQHYSHTVSAHHRREDTYADVHQCDTCRSWY